MVFSFIHSANLIPFVVVLYFHGGRSTTSISPSSSVLNNASESDVSTSLMTFTTTGYQAPPSISKTTTLTSSVSATVTPTKKTIVNFTCILLKPWNDTLHNTSSGDYIKLKKEVKDALEKLYSDSKYDLEKSSIVVSFTKRGKDVTINAVVTFGNGITAQSVEDDFLDSVEKETLDIEKISKEDARATPKGVDFEWKADDGECERACSDSETSTGQSFKLKRTCTDGANSCKGLNKKKETTDCKEYCASSVASHLSFPLSGLVIALLAPMSLQL